MYSDDDEYITEEERSKIWQAKNNAGLGTGAGTTAGMVVGGIIGGVLGAPAGGVGAVPGAMLGSSIGGAVGGAIGTGIGNLTGAAAEEEAINLQEQRTARRADAMARQNRTAELLGSWLNVRGF